MKGFVNNIKGFVILSIETMDFYRVANKIVLFQTEDYAHSIGISKVGIYTTIEINVDDNNEHLFEFCKK